MKTPTIEEITKSAQELYEWSFRRIRKAQDGSASREEIARLEGINEAAGTLLLQLIGGAGLYELTESLQVEE